MNHRELLRGAACASLLFLAGCAAGAAAGGGGGGGGGGAATPGPMQLKVTAGARLNPDEYGNSLPTAVRVYQLKSAGKTASADLSALLRDPKEVLGDDFVSMDEVFVEPKGSAEKTIAREKDARVVMIVAIVRRPSGDAWRIVYELPPSAKTALLDVAVEEYRIFSK